MNEEKLKQIIKYLPLAIAAGYFTFLIASWAVYVRDRQQMMARFDVALEEWVSAKRIPDAKPNDID